MTILFIACPYSVLFIRYDTIRYDIVMFKCRILLKPKECVRHLALTLPSMNGLNTSEPAIVYTFVVLGIWAFFKGLFFSILRLGRNNMQKHFEVSSVHEY